MEIYRLPVLRDNYIFLLFDPTSHVAAVVDPAESEPVLEKLALLQAQLVAIFNTHHHSDHVGGNLKLIEHFPQLTVYAGASDQGRIPGQKVFLQDGDQVPFADRTAEVFFIPGHTKAHIAYYFPPTPAGEVGELFCGDTVFGAGCGRLLEGTAVQMLTSIDKLRNLPDHTRIWCAHEYTLNNLKFALTVDPDNPNLQQRFEVVKEARNRQEATIPSTIGIEKQTNPFFRWDNPTIQRSVNSKDSNETFARLRSRKDVF